jgi:hypothetical protein
MQQEHKLSQLFGTANEYKINERFKGRLHLKEERDSGSLLTELSPNQNDQLSISGRWEEDYQVQGDLDTLPPLRFPQISILSPLPASQKSHPALPFPYTCLSKY